MVLIIAAVTLALTAVSFSGYFQRTSAERAARVFARDLVLARAAAVRGQENVVIRFYETSKWYSVTGVDSGREFARRRFGVNADISLSAIDLALSGDSLVFNSRGIADLSGTGSSLGTATFTSGPATFQVSFNSLGASKVEEI